MRLTTKGLIDNTKTDDIPYLERYKKLSQLEDIEEELGIDLITLFKALKNGIYVNEDYIDYGTTNNFLIPDNLDCDLELKQLNNGLFLKDYGKTWALAKEELL